MCKLFFFREKRKEKKARVATGIGKPRRGATLIA
jgi:hypothetical protein